MAANQLVREAIALPRVKPAQLGDRVVKVVAAVLCLLTVLAACNPWSIRQPIEKEVILKSRDEIKIYRDFHRTFPNTFEFISYINGRYGPPTWNSKTVIFGRYIFEVQVRVSIDKASLAKPIADPKFSLREVVRVDVIDGQEHGYYGRSLTISLEDWNKLIESGGNFSALGIQLVENSPVRGLENWRAY